MATQVTGELYYELDGQLAEIKRQLRQPTGYPFDPRHLKIALQQAIEGNFNGIGVPTMGARAQTLVLFKTASLASAEPKKTKDCFTSKLWAYRDGDIDGWLPREQAANGADSVGIYQLQNPKGTTFLEMARAAVQAVPGTTEDEIVSRLIARGLTVTLAEVEALVERQESGEDVGLCTNSYASYANFAFVDDADGSVSVLGFDRRDRRWGADVLRLDYGPRWIAESRLLLRNSDTRAL